MRQALPGLPVLGAGWPTPAQACSACRGAVFATVFDSHFLWRVLLLALPLLLVAALAFGLERGRPSRPGGDGGHA